MPFDQVMCAVCSSVEFIDVFLCIYPSTLFDVYNKNILFLKFGTASL